MHYYKFNITDWQASTRHLTPEQEGVYFRLINHYYDTEKPLPLDFKPLLRRLMLETHWVLVQEILEEFFVKTDDGYEKQKCNDIIKEYKRMANKNKKNGKLGGRPRKIKASKETQSVSSGNPVATQSKPTGNPNQEPLTTNQEPETSNQEPLLKELDLTSSDPKRFKKPCVGEVTAHFHDKGLSTAAHEAEKFFNYYESNGWMVGKNKMKSWKHAANNWASRVNDMVPQGVRHVNGHQHVDQSGFLDSLDENYIDGEVIHGQ